MKVKELYKILKKAMRNGQKDIEIKIVTNHDSDILQVVIWPGQIDLIKGE